MCASLGVRLWVCASVCVCVCRGWGERARVSKRAINDKTQAEALGISSSPPGDTAVLPMTTAQGPVQSSLSEAVTAKELIV